MKQKQKWFIGILILCGLFGVFLTLLPLIVKQQAITWFTQNGLDEAKIGDVDINLFTGQLAIIDLQLQKDGTTPLKFWRLTADVEWWPLLRKRLLIKDIWLYDVDLLIAQDKQQLLHIGGITLPTAGAAQSETKPETETDGTRQWGVGLDALGIKNAKLRIQSPQFTVDQEVLINSLNVSDILSWTPEHPAPVNLDMLVDGNAILIQSKVRAFQSNPDIKTTLKISQLDLSRYAPISRLFGIDELAGNLNVDMESSVVLQAQNSSNTNAVAIDIKTDVELSDFNIRYGDLHVANQYFNYFGNASLHLPASPGIQLLTTEGEATMDKLAIASGLMNISYDNLSWRGQSQIIPSTSQEATHPPKIKVSGELGIRDLVIEDTQHHLDLARINKISTEGLSVNLPQQIQLKSVSIASLQALQPQSVPTSTANTLQHEAKPVVDIANVFLDNVTYRMMPASLDLSSVDIVGMTLFGKRETDGSFYAIDQLRSPPMAAENAQTGNKDNQPASDAATADTPATIHTNDSNTANKTDPLRINIGKIKLEPNSEVVFIDQSVKPEFKATISPLSLVLNHIDSSDAQSTTDVDFYAALSKGNDISIKGKLTPFANKHDVHLKTKIKALDLVFASPYASTAIGYFIKSGRLNAVLAVDVAQDNLNLSSQFEFQRLILASASEDARMASSKSIGIPLGAALALMKDKHGNIELEVPVQGDLSDPGFDLGPAIRSAGTEAVKKASVAYATLALQPYGAILLGAKLLSAATAMRLESVRFDPGKPEINSEAQNYLEKIGALMKERPGINLTLCGIATPQDEAALKQQALAQAQAKQATEQSKQDTQKQSVPVQKTPQQLQDEAKLLLEQLHRLADLRGENVKQYLIGTQKIAADRFFDCQTTLSEDETAQPEVALGL